MFCTCRTFKTPLEAFLISHPILSYLIENERDGGQGMDITQSEVDAVKALLKIGRIEDARAILASFDGSKAKAMLTKFNEKYPEKEKGRGHITPAKPAQGSKQPNYLLWGGIAATILIGALLIWQIPVVKFTVYNASIRLYGACLRQTWDRFGYDRDTSGCSGEVERAIEVYSEEIVYCLESSSQTDNRFEACLKEEGVLLIS